MRVWRSDRQGRILGRGNNVKSKQPTFWDQVPFFRGKKNICGEIRVVILDIHITRGTSPKPSCLRLVPYSDLVHFSQITTHVSYSLEKTRYRENFGGQMSGQFHWRFS